VVHADLVANHKPHPEGLELAASQMGLEVSELVMVGDMMQDIKVAQNAGALASVGVTHGFSTRETLEELGASYVIDNLPELVEVIDDLARKHDA
jgi:phosphoglycolate phosphatase